jgi:Ca-activated chloride channel homolog
MDEARALLIAFRAVLDEGVRTGWSELRFAAPRPAVLVFTVLLALTALLLVVATLQRRRGGRTHLVFPALVPLMRRSPFAAFRHLPMLLFVAGLPLLGIALADPHTGFTREEVSYPGRRVALLVDASGSMVLKFGATNFKTRGESTFFTAVAAAEHFIQRRIDGPYRDLVALIQFGNQAYVVTPFTTDYQSIRLSIRLISDPREWGRFNDFGTTIVEGIDQGMRLFKTFDFVNTSGNLMILFTDGRDSELNQRDRPLEQLLADSRRFQIPVYMVRTAFNLQEGQIREDKIWKATIEKTGGRFYAAYDDASIRRAIADIDRLSPGRIDVREYSVERPRFAAYMLAAVVLWLVAALLKLGFREFRTFP